MSFDDRAVGCLLGLAVGDALGTTLEFTKRDSLPPVTDLVGGGPFELAPGQWTDDTSMALCLADSLIDKGELNDVDVMKRFVRWYREGENSCTGTCFDIGNATRTALAHYEETGRLLPRGGDAAGNGSLMRLAPIPIFYASDTHLAGQMGERQSYLTHTADEAAVLCRLFSDMLVAAMNGEPKADVLRYWGHIGRRSRRAVQSSGYVVHTFEAAIWAVWNTGSFDGAVIAAANLGDDADTVAAVTGQLAGALYGKAGIPTKWLAKLAWCEHIEAIARKLVRASKGSPT